MGDAAQSLGGRRIGNFDSFHLTAALASVGVQFRQRA